MPSCRLRKDGVCRNSVCLLIEKENRENRNHGRRQVRRTRDDSGKCALVMDACLSHASGLLNVYMIVLTRAQRLYRRSPGGNWMIRSIIMTRHSIHPSVMRIAHISIYMIDARTRHCLVSTGPAHDRIVLGRGAAYMPQLLRAGATRLL